jgi:hypothetical protein
MTLLSLGIGICFSPNNNVSHPVQAIFDALLCSFAADEPKSQPPTKNWSREAGKQAENRESLTM